MALNALLVVALTIIFLFFCHIMKAGGKSCELEGELSLKLDGRFVYMERQNKETKKKGFHSLCKISIEPFTFYLIFFFAAMRMTIEGKIGSWFSDIHSRTLMISLNAVNCFCDVNVEASRIG
jgi:hypothetical protein